MLHTSEISSGFSWTDDDEEIWVRRVHDPYRIVKLWVRLEDVERLALVVISVPSYRSVHVFYSTSTWMMPCSVVLGRGWSKRKVVPNLIFLSWWSLIRGGSRALGGGDCFPIGGVIPPCGGRLRGYSGKVVSYVLFPVKMLGQV
jgi:hypothetical protein